MTLTAGYDSQQLAQRNKSGSSVVERSRNDAVGSILNGSEVTVSGRNLSLEAISVNATDAAGAKGDVNIIAQENLALTAGTDTRFEHTVSVNKGGGLLRKKVTTTEHTEQTADAVVSDLSGQDINLKAGGNIDLYGTRINAQGETVLDAGGTLSAYALQNLHTVTDTRKVSRNTFGWGDVLFGINFTMAGASSERTDTTSTQTAVVAHLQSVDSLTTKSGGDTLLQGTRIQASDTRISVGQGDKASAEAKLIIQGAKNRTETSHTISALIDTSINGGDLGDKIGRGLFLGAVDAAGASAANWVGDLDGFSNKVGHLIVGCAMGAAKSGDCASGAVGGLVGELVAEWYGGSRDPVNATQASDTVNIARLFGALTNTVIGGDAQVGADAAGNAAQNNFLNHAQVKQLNTQLAQCQGQASCISQTIDDARALDKRQHDLIGQTETIQGSRALVEGIQRPGATIDTSLCAGVSACVQYAAELPLINSRDYIYGTQDRLGELAQIKRIHAFETQIRQANPELSDEEVTRQAGVRAGIYDAGRLGQLLGAASRGTGAGGGNAADGLAAGKGGLKGVTLNFYISASGETIPATGYRYISSEAPYLQELISTGKIPENSRGTYISFDNFGSEAAGKLQVPHDAVIKVEFDTKQILGDLEIPKGMWGKADYLEPLATDFPQFGTGGATQAVTKRQIILDKITDERTGKVLYERGR